SRSVSTVWSNCRRSAAQDHLSVETGQHRADYYRLAIMKKTKQDSKLSTTSGRTRAAALRSRKASVEEIDVRVIAEAEDDTAWEPAVRVSRKQAAIGLPASLAQRAAFLARLHREQDLQSWVERVVRERVELEERAFTQARRELASKPGA
ncbi:MAG TPA: hypothetical protein VN605_07895, partial [Thermoanaerobaculia bacterium]|nr:hypothetical protein [Thermoanaerobaculia bacterium]